MRTKWTESGLLTLADLFKSVVDGGMGGGLIMGNCHVFGPGSGPTAVNVCTVLDSLARSVRLTRVFETEDCLEPKVLSATVAAEVAGLASTYSRAATVGFWWEYEDEDDEATHALDALIKVAHVVIEVVGFDEHGPLLTVSSRTSLDDDLPFQRLIPGS
ncbi:hypothetical protein [Pedococcus bigeumensis]|uniref:hypothetical protein n=1 Tax=Pedococcus bigeumensis TaxID=433644 RepID=UPI001125DEB3|nr:hypothetical protein [Pedococcus bigeumensis]